MKRYVFSSLSVLLTVFMAFGFYACSSGGGGVPPPPAGVTVTESGIPASTDVTEGGATDTYDVVLDSQPTADVTITITPDAQTTVDKPSLTFTDADFDQAQTVTVNAVDDTVIEGSHTSTITHAAVSADTDYNAISIGSVTANITDNDGNVSITPQNVNVAEGGATDTYDVVLDSQPTADVTITITPDAQTTVDKPSLTFTDADFDQAQTVTVTAVDDIAREGTHTSTVSHAASSSDTIYNGIAINDVTADVTDNDRFAFVANRTSGNISIYSVDPTSGALSPDPGSTFLIDAAAGSFAVAAHPSGQFLYVANADNDTVSALAIDAATGALSLIETKTAAGGAMPFSVAVERTGTYLYVANIGTGDVSAFSINQTTGELAELTSLGSPFPSGTQARFVAPHPTADFLYVANEAVDNVAGFVINPDGSLSAIGGSNSSPYTVAPQGRSPRSLAIDPAGQYLYTANYDAASVTGSVTAFQIDDGALLNDAGSLNRINTIVTGERTRSVAVHPNGGFVYALNERDANIEAFAIEDGSTGTPGDLISPSTVPGSPFPTSAAANPPDNNDRSYTVTIDPNGNFAYATNFNDGTVDAFIINNIDGSLSTPPSTVSAGTGPAGITVLGVLP